MRPLDAATREYLKREIDRRRRIEIEGLRAHAPRWTYATVLDSIRSFEAMTGRPPTRSDFDSADTRLPSARTCGRIFGSVARALAAAYPAPLVEIEQATLFDHAA